eukprot:15479544-Alexandrium_andersonii.AAC.1
MTRTCRPAGLLGAAAASIWKFRPYSSSANELCRAVACGLVWCPQAATQDYARAHRTSSGCNVYLSGCQPTNQLRCTPM